MEEDIKILEKIREESINAAANACTGAMSNIWRREAQAIENLLKRYKELEEGCKTCIIRNDLNDYVENSISISVIQNKKRELEKKKEYLWDEYDESVVEVMCRYSCAIQVLQELLEERNK